MARSFPTPEVTFGKRAWWYSNTVGSVRRRSSTDREARSRNNKDLLGWWDYRDCSGWSTRKTESTYWSRRLRCLLRSFEQRPSQKTERAPQQLQEMLAYSLTKKGLERSICSTVECEAKHKSSISPRSQAECTSPLSRIETFFLETINSEIYILACNLTRSLVYATVVQKPAFFSAERICSANRSSGARSNAFVSCSDARLNWPLAI